MTNPNFGGTPFAAGSLCGYRAFGLRPDGILTSPHFPATILPGENTAECLAVEAAWFPTTPPAGATAKGVSIWGQPIADAGEHEVGAMSCSCGFYAYYEGANDYHTGLNVEGILEGYGRVTYGSRGFRASKARVVALVRPNLDEGKYEEHVLTSGAGDLIRYYPLGGVDPGHWLRALRTYEGVPIYGTLEQAKEAHPVGLPEQEQSDV